MDPYMRSTDAFTWYMERDPALRSTVVVTFWLDRTPDWDVLVDRVDRMSRQMLSLRQRVVESPFHLTTPRWTYDDHFDLSWHVRRVTAPEPRTREAVLELARLAAMDAFDRERPLWELTLVEGIKGGGGVVIIKFHHSLSDGVGGIGMLGVVFDLARKPGALGPMPPVPAGESLDQRALIAGALGSAIGRAAHRARHGAVAFVPALVHTARHPVGTARAAAALAGSVYRTAAPMLETKSPVMRERAMTRRLAMMEVPVAALKGAAKTVGVTVNDAFLAALTGGLRRYHERHDSSVESLRVVMPINIRAEGETGWGNRITLQRVTLPVGETDPAARMRLVHHAARAARNEPSLPVTEAIAEGLNLLPTSYVGGVLKHIDFLASNVPGSPVPIYLAGSRVTGMFAFGPTIGTALNVTLVSHLETCDIGINIDTSSVPDPDVMLECLQESFDEITSLGAAGVGIAD